MINLLKNKKSCKFICSNVFKKFSTSLKKDYYAILGVPLTASNEEIKKAYHSLAKKYHPDVTTKVEHNLIQMEKFRDVAEAYAVLTNALARHKYDLTKNSNPDAIFNKNKMEKTRDFTGNLAKENYTKGSYGDFKKERMDKWRKEFNVDGLNNFKGGVPRKNSGSNRAGALGNPGEPYDVYMHNETWADNPLIKDTINEDVSEHKYFMNERRAQNSRFKPFFNIVKREPTTQYEQTQENRSNFNFSAIFFLGVIFYTIAIQIKNRYDYKNLNEKIANLKNHEYDQLGPIVIEAENFKFNTKYQTREQYHKWLDNDVRSFK